MAGKGQLCSGAEAEDRDAFLKLFPSFNPDLRGPRPAELQVDDLDLRDSHDSLPEQDYANQEAHSLRLEHLHGLQQLQAGRQCCTIQLGHAPDSMASCSSSYLSPLSSTVLQVPMGTTGLPRPELPDSPFKGSTVDDGGTCQLVAVRANSSQAHRQPDQPSSSIHSHMLARWRSTPAPDMPELLQALPMPVSLPSADFTEQVPAPSTPAPGTKARSSKYRGVTKHRRSGRWEAHIWVKDLGRQVYLGGYEHEHCAAEAHDVAALKCKGRRVKTNFKIEKYADLIAVMDSISLDELIMTVRRQSQGFSRGSSAYRGVTRHPTGRWEARVGVPGSKHVYLGLWDREEEAARAYDSALVRLRGGAAATNFALSEYRTDLAAYHKLHQELLGAEVDATRLLEQGAAFEAWLRGGMPPPQKKAPSRGLTQEPEPVAITERELVLAAQQPAHPRQGLRAGVRRPAGTESSHDTASSDEDWRE